MEIFEKFSKFVIRSRDVSSNSLVIRYSTANIFVEGLATSLLNTIELVQTPGIAIKIHLKGIWSAEEINKAPMHIAQ